MDGMTPAEWKAKLENWLSESKKAMLHAELSSPVNDGRIDGLLLVQDWLARNPMPECQKCASENVRQFPVLHDEALAKLFAAATGVDRRFDTTDCKVWIEAQELKQALADIARFVPGGDK